MAPFVWKKKYIYEVTWLHLNLAGEKQLQGRQQEGGVLDRPSRPSSHRFPPLQPPKPCLFPESRTATDMAAVPVYSVTRAEIDEFWRRKEVEAEERRLAADKEAARIKAKVLKMEDYALFEQMIREILKEGNTGGGATMGPAAAGATEARIIGIKHWWTRSAYAYLNAPALSMDENGGSKHAISYLPQERCTMFFSSACQPNPTAFAIF